MAIGNLSNQNDMSFTKLSSGVDGSAESILAIFLWNSLWPVYKPYKKINPILVTLRKDTFYSDHPDSSCLSPNKFRSSQKSKPSSKDKDLPSRIFD